MRRVLAATLLAAACGDDVPEPPPGDRVELTVEILHVGLGLPATYPDERLAALGDALRESPADVICIQGTWRAEDRNALAAAVSASLPFSLDLATGDSTPVDDPTGVDGAVPVMEIEPACPPEEEVKLGAMLYCLRNQCCTAPGDNACVMLGELCLEAERCGDYLDGLVSDVDPRQRCRACFLSHAQGGSTLAEIGERCRNLPGTPLAHDGQHGMMLLSKLPLTRPGIHVLPGESLRRAVLSATADTAAGPVDVHCASLGPGEIGLPGDPATSEAYPGPYGNAQGGWGAEHALQVQKLLAYVGQRSADRPAVIMGNFGASDGVTRDGEVVLTASAPLAVARLIAAYEEAVVPGTAPACTLCPQNRIVDVDTAPSWLNRIYLSGMPGAELRGSARTYLGNVVEVPPGGVITLVPLTVQHGFRSTVALEGP